ncbi:hypothetical protein FB451DRAFT_665272 [Mycena latifolia]|nr:hypothetical protein FB451DRAFT_665272 [Mycena latifolia]
MSGVFVIVDDQDQNINYSPGWGPTTAKTTFEFGGTLTAPGPQGATASYVFNGTSISVFSMVGRNPNVTTTLSFAIDGKFVNSTAVQADSEEHFHRRLFSSPTLEDGSHTLEITLSDITSSDVFLDYLIYEASPNCPLSDSVRLLALDTSPHLSYSQGWSAGVTLRPGLVEGAVSLNDSVESAQELGATVALNFTGRGFEVHGLLLSPFPSPVASYSLDGGPWTDVEMPANSTSYEDAVNNFVFIGQTFGEVGTHSLVITPQIPAAFFLDYIMVQAPTAAFPAKAAIAAPPAVTSSSHSATSSAPLTEPLPTSVGVAGPSSSAAEALPLTAPNHAGAHLQAGAIAGIVVSVAACLGVASVAWFLLRRRRTPRSKQLSVPDQQEDGRTLTRWGMRNTHVTPYTVTTAHPVSKLDRFDAGRRLNIEPAEVERPEPANAARTLPPAYSDRWTRQ